MSSTWNPAQYLLFENERTRPCRDLAAQIPLPNPEAIIDLGCGPGNSTSVLAERWPAARVTGLDNSAQMLEQARASYPRYEWQQAQIDAWANQSAPRYDIVFSNAALQWVPDHRTLYPNLLNRVAPGGVLAVQVPANLDAPAQVAIRSLAASPAWKNHFPPEGVRKWHVHEAAFYYDLLAPRAAAVQLWYTTYIQVMPNSESIAEWYKGTALRPYLAALPDEPHRKRFLDDYLEQLREVYPAQPDGRVLFPFRRLFLVAGVPGK